MFWKTSKEFTENYKALFKGNFNPKEFSVFGYKIGDNANSIDTNNIVETTFHKLPEGIKHSTYKDHKVFYQKGGQEIEFLLEDRIQSVLNKGGWLQLNEGYSIRIQNKEIVEFMLGKILPKQITNIQKQSITSKFGKPLETKETFEEIDGSLFTTEYFYNESQLRISFDDWDKLISHINIGAPMNKN